LTATIGIASNKLLAKIASDHRKPDGLTVISDHEKVSFLRPLPVRVIYGIGKVTEQAMGRAGIVTVGDLQDYLAVSLGAICSGFIPGLSGKVTTGAMAQLPSVLIPAYLVPIFIMLHVAALAQSRQLACSGKHAHA
jgi:hypothetical protein